MISSAEEAQRTQAARFQIYRDAVLSGFYNEWPETVVYNGYQLVQEGEKVAVVRNGTVLIKVQTKHIAKCWVICRVNNCGLSEATKLVAAEDNTIFCQDCGSYVAQPHDCHD